MITASFQICGTAPVSRLWLNIPVSQMQNPEGDEQGVGCAPDQSQKMYSSVSVCKNPFPAAGKEH
jgi:hypothetical protein